MNTKKLTVLAMFITIAFLLAAIVRVPVVLFLRYDPKDVIITIGGFIYGPMAALLISVIVSAVQMFTVSTTGFIGFVMNILGSASYCCTAAFIYKKNRTMTGAVVGLVAGSILATAVMMLWNYLIMPVFMGMPREQIVPLLIPAMLPFNIVSNGLNTGFTLLLYKRVKQALQATGLLDIRESSESSAQTVKFNIGTMLVAIAVLATCVLWILVLRGIL